jgi:hypothetical protein
MLASTYHDPLPRIPKYLVHGTQSLIDEQQTYLSPELSFYTLGLLHSLVIAWGVRDAAGPKLTGTVVSVQGALLLPGVAAALFCRGSSKQHNDRGWCMC